MAQRRMFSKVITNSSQFLMMPQSSQNLYFHLGMNADDDGFCEHFVIMRMTESKPDDLKILQLKGFVHIFDDKVLVITDWKENNYLRSDRYTPSKYLKLYSNELKLLASESGIPNDNQGYTQDRIGKGRLVEDTNIESSQKISPKTISEDFFNNINSEYRAKALQYLLKKGLAEETIKSEMIKFISYWTELTGSGRKQRWETQKTFEVNRRLATWFSNFGQFNKTNKHNIVII